MTISRRQLIHALGAAAVGAPFASALAQGACRLKVGDPGCDTTAITVSGARPPRAATASISRSNFARLQVCWRFSCAE